MDNIFYIKYITMECILILLLVFVVYSLMKITKSIRNVKRLNKYALKSINQKNCSLGDQIIMSADYLTNRLIKILLKSKYFSSIANKYSKQQPNTKTNEYGLKIIVSKIYTSIGTIIIYIMTSLINKKFSILLAIISLIAGYYLVDMIIKIINHQRNKKIQSDLLKAIIIMNNGFKAGLNINKVIDTVIKDLDGPISDEFKIIKSDLKYGIDLKDAFTRFNDRIQTKDAEYISSSLSILNITGGNITHIFSNIEIALTNKKKINDELKALTASAKLIYQLLKAMPFILVILIYLLNNEYFKPLFTMPLGYIIIIMCVIIYIFYILIVRKILKVNQ